MEGKSLLAVAGCALVGLAVAGCASKYDKVEKSFAQPINCTTAREDIDQLEKEKVGKTEEALAGLSYALPTTIIIGAITGTGGAKSDVSTGDYNRKIDEQIAYIKSTCKLE
jgi:hypothetical protein